MINAFYKIFSLQVCMLKEELAELQQFARPGLLCGRSEQGDGQVGQEEGDVEAMERKKNTQQRERADTVSDGHGHGEDQAAEGAKEVHRNGRWTGERSDCLLI